MDKKLLYKQIAESIRQDILKGRIAPGDRLPSVREMTSHWQCTPGTVQRAYQELARQGLVVSRHGQGTHLVAGISAEEETPLRRATLVHRAEAFLLEVLTAGYTPVEAEQAVRIALDRWRTISEESSAPPPSVLRFVGSHDPAVALIAARSEIAAAGYTLQLNFTGSLGGLIALARGEAELAGSHLWDEETDAYNAPFVRRLLPGRRVALLTLVHRQLGIITPPGNPLGFSGLDDLRRPGLRLVNRQRGSGTRVWLDAQLARLGVQPDEILGYGNDVHTHSEVAQAIAEGQADVGIGVKAAALSFGLDFVLLTRERYDIVIPEETWDCRPIRALKLWLASPEAKGAIADLGGYDTAETGNVEWVA